ncbi:hypothetical protein M885DRAFT_538828 [Pelagophyceae sp. CCMP2097]|nr:hypothetical protein M885DRAFT_538828 [Pelagophyceae sp. CCMP2097]|mmetsp:Transcript_28028/g.96450  ORF Transcript_28028/g.96450 Transcript_28028/m.96450 type:complete len:403 (-) Transcript_28028:50-1258(-)
MERLLKLRTSLYRRTRRESVAAAGAFSDFSEAAAAVVFTEAQQSPKRLYASTQDVRGYPKAWRYGASDIISVGIALGQVYSILFLFGLWIVLIFLFALLLHADDRAVTSPKTSLSANFKECMWLSVQAISTIGFGGLQPHSDYGNSVIAVESFVGVLYSALLTTVFLAHVLMPNAHWAVAERCVIFEAPDHEQGHSTRYLQFRVVFASRRRYDDVKATAQVVMLKFDADGEFAAVATYTLPLVNDEFICGEGALSFDHRVADGSPLGHIRTEADLRYVHRIFFKLEAKDPWLRSAVAMTHAYDSAAVSLDHRFVDMYQHDTAHAFYIDARALSQTTPDFEAAEAPSEDVFEASNPFAATSPLHDEQFERREGERRGSLDDDSHLLVSQFVFAPGPPSSLLVP